MTSDSSTQTTGLAAEFDKSIDRQIVSLQGKAFTLIAMLFHRPLATASDPLFRTELGERYFTGKSLVVGVSLYIAATVASVAVTHSETTGRPGSFWELIPWWGSILTKLHIPAIVGVLFTLDFFFLGWRNLQLTAERQARGAVWHSFSRGKSLYGTEDPMRDLVITVIITVVMLLLCPLVGLLFLASRILSCQLLAREQARVYATYLDIMDAKIANDNLQTAVDRGTPPTQNAGLYGPLPSCFQGEHRKSIARLGTLPDRRAYAAMTEETSPNPSSSQTKSASSVNKDTSQASEQPRSETALAPSNFTETDQSPETELRQSLARLFNLWPAEATATTPATNTQDIPAPQRPVASNLRTLFGRVFTPKIAERLMTLSAEDRAALPTDDELEMMLRIAEIKHNEMCPVPLYLFPSVYEENKTFRHDFFTAPDPIKESNEPLIQELRLLAHQVEEKAYAIYEQNKTAAESLFPKLVNEPTLQAIFHNYYLSARHGAILKQQIQNLETCSNRELASNCIKLLAPISNDYFEIIHHAKRLESELAARLQPQG